MTWPQLARAGAIAIAVAAAVDPAFTRNRPVPVRVSILHGPDEQAFAEQLQRSGGGAFALTSGLSPDSQALIVIPSHGAALPSVPETARVFVIEPPAPAVDLRVRAFSAPAIAILGRKVVTTAVIGAAGLQGRRVTISLMAGDRLAAREERRVERPSAALELALPFVAATAGFTPLRLEVESGAARAAADSALLVEDRKLRVLFLDGRPSWSSTFVRRALEEDPAFEVSAAISTSLGVTSTAGRPARLDDLAEREQLDAVVTGTPGSLSPDSIGRLAEFARDRGGAVILLADLEGGAVLTRLTGLGPWQRRTLSAPTAASSAHGSLRMSDVLFAAPSSLPAATLATLENRPVVQQIPLGAGSVIASGMLDAWRHRAGEGAAFGAFWRGVIGEAALAAVPPLRVRARMLRTEPGGMIEIDASVRDARSGDPIEVEAVLEHDGAGQPLRLWPSAAPGVFRAELVAPSAPGPVRVNVKAEMSSGAREAHTDVLVLPGQPAGDDAGPGAALLASTHGGVHIPGGNAGELWQALREAFPAHQAPVSIHPMRYAGWLLPFTLLLGIEWRWRRRHGLK
ncbi:MAG: hypothetical protein WD690_02295 [Vicinamibacterales bacterium]